MLIWSRSTYRRDRRPLPFLIGMDASYPVRDTDERLPQEEVVEDLLCLHLLVDHQVDEMVHGRLDVLLLEGVELFLGSRCEARDQEVRLVRRDGRGPVGLPRRATRGLAQGVSVVLARISLTRGVLRS